MNIKKQKGFIQNTLNSFVAIPLIISSLTGLNPDVAEVTNTIVSEEISVVAELSSSDILVSKEAQKIDAYFADRNMPLEGYGEVFVREARKNNLDPFLIAAIAVRESSGGRNACTGATHSFLGWGSCNIDFVSTEEAIRIVSWNLGGNNPNTEHFYANKNTKEILQTYNPPSIVAEYAYEVMDVMEKMRNYDV